MRGFLDFVIEHTAMVIDLIALIIVAAGTLEAFLFGIKSMVSPSTDPHGERSVWLRYARWLVAGLTFQLGADIIETSVSPSWDQIGRIGAIAAIRTFLNYFLERDIEDFRKREGERERQPTPGWRRGVPGEAA